jgi:hypothetical protein
MSTQHSGALNRVAFVVTLLVAWFALDRLVSSPPNLLSATAALLVSTSALVLGQCVLGFPWRAIPTSLGLGRPAWRSSMG